MMFLSCTLISLSLILLGSLTNGLCIGVFLRERFRHRIVTPYFIALLVADSIYLAFRLIKLLYYSQTLFKPMIRSDEFCSKTFLARAYQQATQTWPQFLIPFIHSETYIRFSLILMCIISVQRTIVISQSLKRLIIRKRSRRSHKYQWTIGFIVLAFLLAYLSEFLGLTIFCSKTIDRQMTFQWFNYINEHMPNNTHLLTDVLTDEIDRYQCVNDVMENFRKYNDTSMLYHGSECQHEDLIEILSNAFDQHQRSIVKLIQRIFYHQTGQRLSRNEIRRKYHFHECLFPQESIWFDRHYQFL